ncbi:MAG TPA: hypothetical protein VG033_00960 [Candidatus Acidoferrales bacterium]|nr:hypothetical protein [Candidatus Acidoferrales bacterium]
MSISAVLNSVTSARRFARAHARKSRWGATAAALLCAFAIFFATSIPAMAQAGQLDPTFGNHGIVVTTNTVAQVAALQTDGKILVGGSAVNSQAAVARYNPDGTLDSAFGNHGFFVNTVRNGASVFGIAVQSDGKIVAASPAELNLDVFRLNTNGSLDTTFGTNGIVTFRPLSFSFGQTPGALVVQPDGKILVAAGITAARLLADGEFDSTFGNGGLAPLLTGVGALVLLPGDKFLVGSNGVSRYNSDGSLDTTFGVAGEAAAYGSGSAISLLTGGKFLVGGSLVTQIMPPVGNNISGFSLVRNNSNGTIDTTFRTRGGEVTQFPGDVSAGIAALAIQSNGDIVGGGSATTTVNAPSAFALARYSSTGQLDATFGTGGFVTTSFGSTSSSISVLLIQTDGKIVAVGNSNGITLARYLAR